MFVCVEYLFELAYCAPPLGLNLFIASFRFEKPLVSLYKALGGGWQIDAEERAGSAAPNGGAPQPAPATR